MHHIPHIFETAMMLCFGLSWPVNALKSWRSRTAKGKSLAFLLLIFTGYVLGIAGKVLANSFVWHVMAVYIFNISMVGLDIALYLRNSRLDARRDRGELTD